MASKPKRTRKAWIAHLTTKREALRTRNAKRNVKQHYDDPNADYLLSKVAEVLAMAHPITPAEGRDGKHTVTVDARKVVRGGARYDHTRTLWVRPDRAVGERLAGMVTYAPEVRKVAHLRYLPTTKHPDYRPDSDNAYLVILYLTK